MKYLQRYLLLLFALVMCVGLFSVTAHAETESKLVHTYTSGWVNNDESTYNALVSIDTFNGNGTIERGTITKTIVVDDTLTLASEYTVANNDKTAVLKAGKEATVKLENTYATYLLTNPITNSMKYFYHKDTSTVRAYLHYTDGSVETYTVNAKMTVKDKGKYDFTVTVKPSKDVQKVRFYVLTDYKTNDFYQYAEYDDESIMYTKLTINIGEYVDTDNAFSFTEKSEEASLLDGILGWIKNIFNSVKETAENVKNGFTNIINSLVELPAKLWEKISDGLKSLFVPSEESMTAYKDKWDELLASRLGAVYQVVNIITDSWDGVMNADETDTIEFPEATLEFSGTEFTFGGYEVKIVPEGFGVLVTPIKSIVAIVCTVAFVNGLRKRYDEVMGVEQ